MTGADPWPWFRFPFGITTQLIINRVPGSLRPGEIVLMHCGPGGMKAGDHSTLRGAGRHRHRRRLATLGHTGPEVPDGGDLGIWMAAAEGCLAWG